MEVDEAFDRAWRRVGLALDRGGFTVEDRDRSAGLYYVRYVDPRSAGKDEPGFFSKLFGWDSKEASSALQRYRLSVKTTGATTQVAVLNNQGNADSGEAARQIVARLVDELK
jgi:outer membrane protein assembly factor BamC